MSEGARRGRLLARLGAALLTGGIGVLVLSDSPGLATEYFALTPHWDGPPVHTTVGEPRVEGPGPLAEVLVSTEIFSVRWRGWVVVPVGGDHEFVLKAHRGAYLRLDDEIVVDTKGVFGARSERGLRVVDRGVHAIEIGLYQHTGGESRLHTLWKPPGGSLQPLPAEGLYGRRPLWPRRLLRRGLAWLPAPQRRLLGALLALGALLVLWGGLAGSDAKLVSLREKLHRRLASPRVQRWAYAAFFLGLLVVTWLAMMPYTASTVGGDDVHYQGAARFDSRSGGWFLNRYVHIYLLKLFIWLRDADAFLGSRTYWSFLFAVTVASVAVGIRALGPGLQLRTLAVALFLLGSQTRLMGNVGAVFPDYSAMMFVAAAVAVYLHGLSRPPTASTREWHALAIGALTVAAFKSKETGVILAWLPLVFLWSEGRLDLGRFARRMGYWLAGALAAWLVLMTLDGWLLGDFWYGLRAENLSASREVNFPDDHASRDSISGWLGVVWGQRAGDPAGHSSLRNLALLVLVAALSATLRRRRIELRLLHLMPMVYLLMLIILHVWAPHPFTARYLYPILPVCCLLGASFIREAGLEARSFRAGALVLAVLLFFGAGFELSRSSLARHLAVQRGDLILYPWKVFEKEIVTAHPQSVVVSPELYRRYRMVGQQATRQQIARLYFGRLDLRMWQSRSVGSDADLGIASRGDLAEWERALPGLGVGARSDPSGQILLVEPAAVAPR